MDECVKVMKQLADMLSDCTMLSQACGFRTGKAVSKCEYAHPELQYPTWEQWQRSIYKEACNLISPCMFVPSKRLNCGAVVKGGLKCNDCRQKRIPADIAEKLGIKPGEEWE